MKNVCGIDEAGRGPLAGPVTAAAVVLPEGFPLGLLADSKTLSHRRRAEALKEILSLCHCGVGWVWPEEIDRINIHNAALLAMSRAWEALCSCTVRCAVQDIPHIQVDGKYPPRLAHRSVEAVIRGDSIHPHIQAASILAKEARDRWMIRYNALEPLWQFDRHKGYPTALHRQLCREHGLSPIHRRSFRIFSS